MILNPQPGDRVRANRDIERIRDRHKRERFYWVRRGDELLVHRIAPADLGYPLTVAHVGESEERAFGARPEELDPIEEVQDAAE